jgi:hypothetical protein
MLALVRTALVILLAATAAILGPATTRASTGPYLDFGARADFVDNKVVTIGAEGVPVVHYSWGVEDNPVTVSHWALQHWSRWLTTQAAGDLDPVITSADWLVGRQRDDGGWTYAFDFNALGVPMHAPWISAMAQGMGISVLVRANEATGDDRYLQAAELALFPFSKTVTDGGVVTDWSGVPWYEEYPGEQSQHVLNGFEFTLLGLHDLADRSATARDLWNAGVASLVARIGVYDIPSARTQLYAALNGGRVQVAGTGYQHEHAILTRTLATLTGEQTLADYANRWEQYERQPATVRTPAPAPVSPVLPVAPVAQTRSAPTSCWFHRYRVRYRGVSCRTARRVISRAVHHRTRRWRWRCKHTPGRYVCRNNSRRATGTRSPGR